MTQSAEDEIIVNSNKKKNWLRAYAVGMNGPVHCDAIDF